MNQYITYIALAVEIITAMIIVAQTKRKQYTFGLQYQLWLHS